MAIELPPLPFGQRDLEPFLSHKTVECHYEKHHRNYVDTVNALIQGTQLDEIGLDDLLFESWGKNTKLFNNASQVWNHNFFWTCLTPQYQEPSAQLRDALARDFGSLSELQEQFDHHAKELFGSGWVWLVKTSRGEIKVRSLSDAENPLMVGETPLLTCDVWEHAYYLDYQNERAKYVTAFWSAINWATVEQCLGNGANATGTPTWRQKTA